METQISLTASQKKAYDLIMSGVDVFVTGGAGTGKSFLIQTVIGDLQHAGKGCLVCAPTGTAAANVRGVTVHKAFGLRAEPCITETAHKIIVHVPQLVRDADVIIIDEVSMCRMDLMDSVFASVEKARKKYGHEIQMVIFGDFCQLPPVIRDSGERELLEAYYGRKIGPGYAFQANGWINAGFTVAELTECVRQKDSEFIRNLNKIRMNDPSALEYFNLRASYTDDAEAIGICAYNSMADQINENALDRLEGEIFTFEPIYHGRDITEVDLPTPVSVKQGAAVIITTNNGYCVSEYVSDLNTKRGKRCFHNGSTGIVVEAFRDVNDPMRDHVIVQVSGGGCFMFYRQAQFIYDFKTDSSGIVKREVKGKILQVPIKLAYGITIHRSQGQTYDSINLDPTGWSPGQLYVALSRLTSIDGLHLRRRISPVDMHTDPLVVEFYEHLHDPNYIPSWLQETSPEAAEKPVETVCSFKKYDTNEVAKNCMASKPTHVNKTGDADTKKIIEPLNYEEQKRTERKRSGRPPRYPNGSKVIRIPLEIYDEISWLISVICPSNGMDKAEVDAFKLMVRYGKERYLKGNDSCSLIECFSPDK